MSDTGKKRSVMVRSGRRWVRLGALLSIAGWPLAAGAQSEPAAPTAEPAGADPAAAAEPAAAEPDPAAPADVAPAAPATPTELIADGDFGPNQTAWGDAPIVDGKLCLDVAGGTINPWDAGVSQSGVPIVAGETYELSFDASASPRPVVVRALVQVPAPPYATALDRNPTLTPDTQHFSFTFRATADMTAAVSLQVGGASEAWTLCLDNFSLKSGATFVPYAPNTGPRVRVNQVGYLPHGPKGATLVTGASDPVHWRLRDERGEVVARGKSTPYGVDATSGLNVHEIRFDRAHASGKGFRLEADGEISHPFDIDDNVYESLRTDAFAFFYTQRSGIAIDGDLAGPAYARAAGHVGILPNLGDTSVPCQTAEATQAAYGEAWTCDYTLDVSGGWYDAGDHGKYVVNGGISVAQMLSTYERSLRAPGASRRALGDGSLAIPEQGNHVPDVLDEARWELEFLLRMQVPSGQPFAGMAHHKIHDSSWSGLPLDPAADPLQRELHRPSTAATLNLAAAAAQGARLFRRFDAAFSDRLLAAARTAYDAAVANPALLAPGSDGSGGGTYGDSDVSDEFYWAAAELYLTTHEQLYLDAVLASPHHTGEVFSVDGFSWGSVAALGRLDLATVPSPLPDVRAVRRSVVQGAEAILALAQAQAWGQPYAPADGGWVWGSSSQVLNNLVVLGSAFDITGDRRFQRAVIEGADFLLGRNALNLSFITGYGDVYSQNQHSRLYGAQLNAELPHPPIGSVAGGPNTGLQDPTVRDLLTGCVGQMCYVDDINSYSTNEIAINWNAPLVWVASFLADQGGCR